MITIVIFGSYVLRPTPWMKRLPLGAHYMYYAYLPGQRLPDIAWGISGNPGKYA